MQELTIFNNKVAISLHLKLTILMKGKGWREVWKNSHKSAAAAKMNLQESRMPAQGRAG